MDASALRWTLAIIGIVLLIGVYLHGLHQNRLRKRTSMQTFAREQVDSAFIEDEALRAELNNLNHITAEADACDNFDDIKINPAIETDLTSFKLPPNWFVPDIVSSLDQQQSINYLLYHADYRLITGKEIKTALSFAGLTVNNDGYIECRDEDELCFTIASLSAPGHFADIDNTDFSTLGFYCFIDLISNHHAPACYERMLNKIDELVRLLDVKVYRTNHHLLTISDVTRARLKLKS